MRIRCPRDVQVIGAIRLLNGERARALECDHTLKFDPSIATRDRSAALGGEEAEISRCPRGEKRAAQSEAMGLLRGSKIVDHPRETVTGKPIFFKRSAPQSLEGLHPFEGLL